jgi:probable DNA metabolism protein
MYSFSVVNFDDWRDTARALLRANIAPSSVSWQPPEQQGLFAFSSLSEVIAQAEPSSGNRPLKIPRDFLERAKQAACFLDKKAPARKWSILYSMLWRIEKYGRETLHLNSDIEVRCLNSMCKAVSRDKHKMKAFVRFQQAVSKGDTPPEQDSPENSTEYYVAWFEPSHVIIESVAPFFVKRFTGMSWSILTPHGCAHWNMEQLRISEGVLKPDISADVFEVFWKTYYCNIFNPARLKEQAMKSEMPKKYWKYLPEASCIQDLTRGAAASTAQMIDSPATASNRAREKSQMVTQFQDKLRANNSADRAAGS